MTFADPAWLWALLLLLPLIGLRIFSHTNSRRNLTGLVAPRLHPLLVRGSSQLRHWLTFTFLATGLACIIIAMARPQYGYEEIESFSEGRSLMIAIDTSRSMLATDLVPNRLERAKLAARDIVDSLPEDRIGLIAFAGRAFIQAPLTTDHLAVIESIEQVDTEVIPRGGTNLTSAVNLALSAFREAESDQNALILFSDGEALEGQEQVDDIKERAQREGMIIISIGVGTERGSIIPEPGSDGQPQEGVFIKDAGGQVVRSRLDPTALRNLASGGGLYLQLGDRASMTRVVKTITQNLTATRESEETRKRPIERFMWPLAAGLFSLILAHLVPLLHFRGARSPGSAVSIRRASPATPALLLSLLFFLPADGFSRNAKEGWKYIEREDFEGAIERFEAALDGKGEVSEREATSIHLGIGSASYKIGDYERATRAFGKALIRPDRRTREQAHYNLGNTLFRKGETTLSPSSGDPNAPQAMSPDPGKIEATLRQWLGALEHFEAALRLNRKNANAQHNIEVLKERIQQLKQEQEEQQQQQQQENEDQEQQDQEQEQPQQNQDNRDQENESDQKSEDQQEQENGEENSQENQDPEKNEDRQEDSKGEQNEPESESDSGKPDEPRDQEEENSGTGNEPPQSDPQPGGEETTQPPDPGEGELSADETGTKPPETKAGSPEMNINPETGYSPSEARQLIEALADEDIELRPLYPRPSRTERYKNW